MTKKPLPDRMLNIGKTIFKHSNDGMVLTSFNGIILDINKTFSEISGYTKKDLLGKSIDILYSNQQSEEFYINLRLKLKENKFWKGEIISNKKNGLNSSEYIYIHALYDINDENQKYIYIFKNNENEKYQLLINNLMDNDPVTGLPGQSYLVNQLQRKIDENIISNEYPVAVILDMDNLRLINSIYGQRACDIFLNNIAIKIKNVIGNNGILGRFSTDEFGIILNNSKSLLNCENQLNNILEVVSSPVKFNTTTIQMAANIGVVLYNKKITDNARKMFRQADQAMYQSKLMGKNKYFVFDEEYNNQITLYHENLEKIRNGFLKKEFLLYYQPKINLINGDVVGFEALIRWDHPNDGMVQPADFLPAIENHPFSIDIGEWVIETAIIQIIEWSRSGFNIPVSVNISAFQLQQKDFLKRLQIIIDKYPNFNASLLEFEVLETTVVNDLDHVFSVIQECRKIGILFSLDDFGTGYSSLTYLKKLPVSVLKIDRTFIVNMLTDKNDQAILKSVIKLAKSFHCKVLAEGVESIKHANMLLKFGCEQAQGFGISRPMSAAAITSWSNEWHTNHEWKVIQ